MQRKTPSFLLYVTPNITPSPSLNPMPYCTTSCIILRQKTMYLHSSIFTGWLKIKCHFKKKKSFASNYDSGAWDEVTSKLLYLVSIEDSVTLLTICYQLKKWQYALEHSVRIYYLPPFFRETEVILLFSMSNSWEFPIAALPFRPWKEAHLMTSPGQQTFRICRSGINSEKSAFFKWKLY